MDFLLFGFIGVIIVFVSLMISAEYQSWRIKYAKNVPEADDLIASTLLDFEYYKRLSIKGRITFVRRVRYIASDKTFTGKNRLEVTDEMRIRIAATIAQLTYGLEDFDIPAFQEIDIYPTTFYNPTLKAKLKGFATPRGKLAVSWVDFLEGYNIPDDNYNLGLHELAHALHINKSVANDNQYFRHHFRYWTEHSLGDFYNLANGHSTFLRKYGATNFHEFFAVVVEHFFESPELFFQKLPNLYLRTCILLNQDPMNNSGDYVFKISNFPLGAFPNDHLKKQKRTWITKYAKD